MRRFWVDALGEVGEPVHLGQRESHHLLRVTGIAPGEVVVLFDGSGSAVEAELTGVKDGIAALKIRELLPGRTEVPVWLLVAQLKRAAFDLALRMGTELGVTTFVPVQASRCVAKGDKRERWERVVRSAAAQSGRVRVPQVLEPLGLPAALERLPPGVPCWMALPGASPVARPTGPVAVLVGPEGGWSPGEVSAAREHGVQGLGLGAFTLRADTAVVSAVAWATSGR